MMLTLKELQERMSKLDNWAIEDKFIVKEVDLKDFKEAIQFVNKIAEIADKHQHHPDLTINFNIVRVSLTTHKEHEITNKDFDVAEEIDKIRFDNEEKKILD